MAVLDQTHSGTGHDITYYVHDYTKIKLLGHAHTHTTFPRISRSLPPLQLYLLLGNECQQLLLLRVVLLSNRLEQVLSANITFIFSPPPSLSLSLSLPLPFSPSPHLPLSLTLSSPSSSPSPSPPLSLPLPLLSLGE